MQRKIFDFIFRENIDNFFICLFLLLLFLLFPFLLIDFGASYRDNGLTDAPHFDHLTTQTNCWSFPYLSATAISCLQNVVLLFIQFLSHLKDPPFPEETKIRLADLAIILQLLVTLGYFRANLSFFTKDQAF